MGTEAKLTSIPSHGYIKRTLCTDLKFLRPTSMVLQRLLVLRSRRWRRCSEELAVVALAAGRHGGGAGGKAVCCARRSRRRRSETLLVLLLIHRLSNTNLYVRWPTMADTED